MKKEIFEKDMISNAEYRLIKYAKDGDMYLKNDEKMSVVIPDIAYHRTPQKAQPPVLRSLEVKE